MVMGWPLVFLGCSLVRVAGEWDARAALLPGLAWRWGWPGGLLGLAVPGAAETRREVRVRDACGVFRSGWALVWLGL